MTALPCYASREEVRASLDFEPSARFDPQIDQVLASSSRRVDQLCHRAFYPTLATRTFGWPDAQYGRSWRLWLDANELISVSELTSNAIVIAATDYFLEPTNYGPPYSHIEIDLASSATFGAGATHQRTISITGLYGYRVTETTAGTCAEALDASETAIDVSDSYGVGVGDLIRVDSERMIVTGKSMLTTGQTLQTPITASKADETLAVTNGAAYVVGETLLLDAERVFIGDIAGNSLIVKRAVDGTTLAAHTGSTIYAPRTLIVTRGVLGTTAATHSTAAPIYRHLWPALVEELAIGLAIDTLQQRSSGYARTVGAGEATRNASGRALRDLMEECRSAHGRKVRVRVV